MGYLVVMRVAQVWLTRGKALVEIFGDLGESRELFLEMLQIKVAE